MYLKKLFLGSLLCKAEEDTQLFLEATDSEKTLFNPQNHPNKRAGGRNFYELTGLDSKKRAIGQAFQFANELEKRAGGRHFNAFEDSKRGGGRSFYEASEPDKRGGGRAFQLSIGQKRAFQFEEEKRAGGREFKSVSLKYSFFLNITNKIFYYFSLMKINAEERIILILIT